MLKTGKRVSTVGFFPTYTVLCFNLFAGDDY